MQTDLISKPLHSKCSCMVCCIGQIIDLDLSCLYQPLTCAPFRPFCRSWPRLTLWVRTRCPTLKVSPNSEVIFWHLLPSKAEPIKLKYLPNWYQQQRSTWDTVTHCMHYQDCDRAIAAARAALERFDGDSRAQERGSTRGNISLSWGSP